jgi:hypothetical protein
VGKSRDVSSDGVKRRNACPTQQAESSIKESRQGERMMQIEVPTFRHRDRFRLHTNGLKGSVVTLFWSERHGKTAYIVLFDQHASITLIWNLEQVADQMMGRAGT